MINLGYMESGVNALLFLAPGFRDSELISELGL